MTEKEDNVEYKRHRTGINCDEFWSIFVNDTRITKDEEFEMEREGKSCLCGCCTPCKVCKCKGCK